MLIEHGGGMEGYRAKLTLVPDAGGAVAILNNGGYGHAANDEILEALLLEVFGVAKDEPQPVRVEDDALGAYAGRYTSSHIDVTFAAEEGSLRGRYKTVWHENDGSDITLDPIAPHEFVIRDGEFVGSRVVFLPDLAEDRMAIRFLSRVIFRAAEAGEPT